MQVEIMDFISIILVPILGHLSWQINRGGSAIEKLTVQFTALNEKVASSYTTLARHEASIKEHAEQIRENEKRIIQKNSPPK